MASIVFLSRADVQKLNRFPPFPFQNKFCTWWKLLTGEIKKRCRRSTRNAGDILVRGIQPADVRRRVRPRLCGTPAQLFFHGYEASRADNSGKHTNQRTPSGRRRPIHRPCVSHYPDCGPISGGSARPGLSFLLPRERTVRNPSLLFFKSPFAREDNG